MNDKNKEKDFIEYLKKRDKEISMIPITFDPIFKGLFLNNLDNLKDFTIDLLEKDIDKETATIELRSNELPVSSNKSYRMVLDISTIINGNIYVDLEVNRKNYNVVKRRNNLFKNKSFGEILKRSQNPFKLPFFEYYQFNLNAREKNSKKGTISVYPFDTDNNKLFFKNEGVFIKYIEYFHKLYYNNDRLLTKSELWLAACGSTTFFELFDIIKKVLPIERAIKFVEEEINLSKDDFNLEAWGREAGDALILYDEEQERLAFEEEKQEFNTEKREFNTEKQEFSSQKQKFTIEQKELSNEKKQLEKEKQQLGKEKQQLSKEKQSYKNNTIISMLKKKFSYKDISDITNCSIDKIKEIESNLL